MQKSSYPKVSSALKMLAIVMLLSSCEEGGTIDSSEYQCLKHESRKGGNGEVAVKTGPLYVGEDTVWDLTEIPVCWEELTYDLQTDADRELVRRSISKTWEAALDFAPVPVDERVRFVGWQKCNETNKNGIRIDVPYGSNEPPGALVGRVMAGRPGGVTLNFDFTRWSSWNCRAPEVARQRCIRNIAIHEFGHALGFRHEHTRPDGDLSVCGDRQIVEDHSKLRGTLLGPWDLESVMNYCNPDWVNKGELSEGDRLGVRAAYYPELYDFVCIGKWRERQPVLKSEAP